MAAKASKQGSCDNILHTARKVSTLLSSANSMTFSDFLDLIDAPCFSSTDTNSGVHQNVCGSRCLISRL